MTTLQEKLAQLSPERQARIRARTDVLALEETTLSGARKRAKVTQVGVAERLGVGQDSVSRLEARKDMLVSTLRHYVAALGGTVRVIVEWEGQPAVELKALGAKKSRATGKKRQADASQDRDVA
jgi:transcriptional regulator with XRE-family HTH domain